MTRLENRLSGLDKLRLEQQAVIDRQRQEITRAQSAIGAPFPQQDALLATKKALDALVTELRGDKDDKDGKKADPATTAAESAGPRHDHADGPARNDPGRTTSPRARAATACPSEPRPRHPRSPRAQTQPRRPHQLPRPRGYPLPPAPATTPNKSSLLGSRPRPLHSPTAPPRTPRPPRLPPAPSRTRTRPPPPSPRTT